MNTNDPTRKRERERKRKRERRGGELFPTFQRGSN
jgi:hypothetical protein